MNLKIITSYQQFSELKALWNQLLVNSGSDHIHSTFDWAETWLEIFTDNVELLLMCAFDGAELIGIAPFIILPVHKINGRLLTFRTVMFIGNGFADQLDFIISKKREEVLKCFFEYLAVNSNLWDEIDLRQLNSASPNFQFIDNLIPSHDKYRISLTPVIRVPFLNTTGNFEDYYKSRAKLFRKQLERYTRHFHEIGNLSLSQVTDTKSGIFSEIYDLNRKRHINTGRRSIFMHERKYKFINSICAKFQAENRLRIFTLRLNEQLIAYDLTFDFNNKIYDWNTSFNLDYQKYSPGRILNKYIIEFCFQNGYSKYDLMAGDEEYKFKWTDTFTSNYNLDINKTKLKNKLVDLAHTIKSKIRT